MKFGDFEISLDAIVVIGVVIMMIASMAFSGGACP